MSDWLRHFQRAKAEAASDEKPDEAQDAPSSLARPLGLVQTSSGASFASEVVNQHTSTLDDTLALGEMDDDYFKKSTAKPPKMSTGDWNRSYPKDIDNIWHQPTLEQISDTLFVVLMNKPHHEPIPVEYDNWVRQLVKGCADLSRTLRATKQLLAEEKETKERSMDEFTQMSIDWEQREAAYKAEIRRMEVLLARSAPSGVEAVLVARSGSIVDRSIAGTKRFRASVQMARGVVSATSNNNTSGPLQGHTDASSFQEGDEAENQNTKQDKALRESFDQDLGAICNKSPPRLDSANVQWPGLSALDHAALGQGMVDEGTHVEDQPHPDQEAIEQECRSHTELSMVQPTGGHKPNQADDGARQSPRENRQSRHTARHGRTFSFNPGVEKLSLPIMQAHIDNSQDDPRVT